jgi:hypothetical protein
LIINSLQIYVAEFAWLVNYTIALMSDDTGKSLQDKLAGLLSKLGIKALSVGWVICQAIWMGVLQLLEPKLSPLTSLEKLLLQLLGASGLFLVALGLAYISLWLRTRTPPLTRRYGVLWDKEANPLCPKKGCGCSVSPKEDYFWCPSCEKKYISTTPRGEPIWAEFACKAMLDNPKGG